MAVSDDLKRLAAQDVAYLTYAPAAGGVIGPGPVAAAAAPALAVVCRGRLRQALNGDWVLNTSTGVNGVAGILLGPQQGTWTSSESPAGGLQVDASGASGQVIIGNVVPNDLVT